MQWELEQRVDRLVRGIWLLHRLFIEVVGRKLVEVDRSIVPHQTGTRRRRSRSILAGAPPKGDADAQPISSITPRRSTPSKIAKRNARELGPFPRTQWRTSIRITLVSKTRGCESNLRLGGVSFYCERIGDVPQRQQERPIARELEGPQVQTPRRRGTMRPQPVRRPVMSNRRFGNSVFLKTTVSSELESNLRASVAS
jgi:hypothetical protein